MGALALHTMLEAARHYEKGNADWISTADLADVLNASRHTLHKVVKRLVQVGLLESARGPQGGVRLAVQPNKVQLLSVVEAVDGPISAGGCLFSRKVCSPGSICQFCEMTVDLEETLRSYFTNTSIADLLVRMREREKNRAANSQQQSTR